MNFWSWKAVLNNLRIWVFTSYKMWYCISVSHCCKRMQRLHLNCWGIQDKSLDHTVPKYKGVPGPTQHPSGSSRALLTIFDPTPPSSFFLFPIMKIALKRKRFQEIADIQLNAIWYRHAIQTYNWMQFGTGMPFINRPTEHVEKLKNRWNHCIQSGGSYCGVTCELFSFPAPNSVPDIFEWPSCCIHFQWSLFVQQHIPKYSTLSCWVKSQWSIKHCKLQ